MKVVLTHCVNYRAHKKKNQTYSAVVESRGTSSNNNKKNLALRTYRLILFEDLLMSMLSTAFEERFPLLDKTSVNTHDDAINVDPDINQPDLDMVEVEGGTALTVMAPVIFFCSCGTIALVLPATVSKVTTLPVSLTNQNKKFILYSLSYFEKSRILYDVLPLGSFNISDFAFFPFSQRQ